MSNISDIAIAIQARAEAVNAKRNEAFTAASTHFITEAGNHVSELDDKIAEQAAAAEAQQLAHDDNFVAKVQEMDAKIANFVANTDDAAIDSLSEQVAAIIAADDLLDDSILSFKSDQRALLTALEAEIGTESDVIVGMGLEDDSEDDTDDSDGSDG